jgi:hypothetical protein
MLNIPGLKGNAYQNKANIPLTPVRMTIINNKKCWPGCEEKRTLIHCWWDCKLHNHYGKQYEGSSKKL